jgi:hypothetical protein
LPSGWKRIPPSRQLGTKNKRERKEKTIIHDHRWTKLWETGKEHFLPLTQDEIIQDRKSPHTQMHHIHSTHHIYPRKMTYMHECSTMICLKPD